LIFYNYTVVPRSSVTVPAASYSRKTSVDEFIKGSSSVAHNEDLNELRQQLHSMKKQALVIMEQSRRSSENEKLALQQAQEALALKETAVTEAAKATPRVDYMLQLMNDSSLDMAGMLSEFDLCQLYPSCLLIRASASITQVLFWILLPKINALKLGPMCFLDLHWSMVLTSGLRLNVPDKSSDFKTARVKFAIFSTSAQGR
jgi:hypothetical protein